ncbi:efflux RND transporter periplasmic adaptor subunit [Variovorax sp. VNK109]|uniref:efflux RND transporter periplasmic adaptor subunit n=1 Tax=Variovorax sp. VNK109 TaxID=3400919 RepID=UPI003C0846D8
MSKNSASPAPRRRKFFRAAGIILGIAVLAAGGWGAWLKWGAPPKAEEYIFATIQRGDIEDLVSATGSLQPRDYVDVGAQVSGQLKKIHVEVGSEVHEGDLLAEIDAEQSAARVDASRAQLRSYQAQLIERETNLAKAERDYQRQRNLMAEEATTAELVQNAETTLRTSRAQINSLKAQMEQLQASMRVEEANLKYTRIYAPMSGTVVSITARQGQTLNTNQSAPTLLRIADLSLMTVQTQVSEADVSRLRPGMQAYFTTLGSQGRRWYGRLNKIEPTPTVTNNVVLYNAVFEVPNPGNLMTQMTAQVFFVVAEARDVLVAPMSSLTIARSAPGQRPAGQGGPGGQAGAGGAAPGAPSSSAAAPSSPSAPVADAPKGDAPKRRDTAAGGDVPRNAQRPAGSEQQRAAGDRPQGGNQPGAGGPRFDREAWSQMSEEERQRMRAERMAARAAAEANGSAQMPKDSPKAGPGAARQRMAGSGAPQATRPPRKATVRVETAEGVIETREVMVGVSNRVHAQILSGLKEGDRVIAGVKVPESQAKRAGSNQQGGQQGPGGAGPGGMNPMGGGVPGTGGAQRR